MEDWDAYINAKQPTFNKFFKPYDPFEGLPRKPIKGTHPTKAKMYLKVAHALWYLAGKSKSLGEWIDFKAEDFVPPRVWSDHSEVDWNKVSPEEKKRRTTITWSFKHPLE